MKWYKKRWFCILGIVLIFIALILLLASPFLINYAYMKGTPDGKPNTAFSAGEMLALYGSIITFLGTVSLGAIAVYESHIANSTSRRLFLLERRREYSCLSLESVNFNAITQENGKYGKAIKIVIKNQGNCPLKNVAVIYSSLFDFEKQEVVLEHAGNRPIGISVPDDTFINCIELGDTIIPDFPILKTIIEGTTFQGVPFRYSVGGVYVNKNGEYVLIEKLVADLLSDTKEK